MVSFSGFFTQSQLRLTKTQMWGLLLLWTVVVSASLAWNIHNERQQTLSLAQKEARANFDKDQAFRLWATKHGGIYVQANARTPPSPHLSHIKERDILTPSGKELTLMNPAYMLRQMMEEFGELYGVKGRIISLKPLNKNNAPDAWESRALKSFESGVEEAFEITDIKGLPHLRLMRPMVTKKGCLKCHGFQGYQVGDIRGGVGVSVPLQPYYSEEQQAVSTFLLSHGSFWLLGLLGIGYLKRQSNRWEEEEYSIQEVLRDSEERFHTLVENAVDAFFLLDTEGRFVDVNTWACKSLGYSREELLALSVSDIDTSFPTDKLKALLDNLQPGKVKTIEGTHLQKFGGEFPVEVRVGLITVGGQRQVMAMARDITKRKQEEEQRRRDKERLSAQYQLAIFPVESEQKLIEYAIEEIVRLTHSEGAYLHFFHPESSEIELYTWSKDVLKICTAVEEKHYPLEIAGIWADCLRQKKPVIHNDYPGMQDMKGLPEGHFPVQRHMSVPIIDGDRIVGIVGVGNKEAPYDEQDAQLLSLYMNSMWSMVKGKRVETELDEVRHYLQNVIDSMPSALVAVDVDGKIIHFNTEAARLSGFSMEEASGRLVDHVLPQLSLQMERIKETLRARKPQRLMRQPQQLENETRFSDVVVYPLVANNVTGAVIRIDDVTDRVRMEEMMVQTEKMMSVGGLAAGMAHEINNPLGGILQGLQNIKRRLSPELPRNREAAERLGVDLEKVQDYLAEREVIHFIQGMSEAGQRASEIVSNMLQFSRRTDTQRESEEITALIERTLELATVDYDLKKKYDFRNIEISREYAADLPRVPCIASEMQQVLLNLLRNAAQALYDQKERTEPARITIRTKAEGAMARIDVVDNGPGMDQETSKRIFEPFFTTRPPGLGTGLGLSVSYFIISEQLGGKMSVDSIPGKGTNISIFLPLDVK
ncbi:MAG: PAS domain S-box protein [Candidatus Sedimenticola sp. (ex Thyasira tokunagai)]